MAVNSKKKKKKELQAKDLQEDAKSCRNYDRRDDTPIPSDQCLETCSTKSLNSVQFHFGGKDTCFKSLMHFS